MVEFIIWLIGFIITFYVMFKREWWKVEDFVNNNKYYDNNYTESIIFWKIIISSLLWFLSVPFYGIWYLLEITIGKKYFNNK